MLISNKAAPYKFEYEIVGEGYDWYIYKEVINWINAQVGKRFATVEKGYEYVLNKTYGTL